MNGWLRMWLAQLERRITNPRDSTNCLVLIEATLPILLLLAGMQLYAAHAEALQHLYRASWLWPSLWAQAALMVWLVTMGGVAWRLRHSNQPLNWLVQLTLFPAVWGMLLLTLSYGIKDTPMSMVLLAELVFARTLFPVRQLRWLLAGALVIVIAAEVADHLGTLPYAPLLARPIYLGDDMHLWWALWARAVFLCGSLPVSGWLFILAATLHHHRRALETLARTDVLTGLANRREFMTKLANEAQRQSRSERPLSIVMFDVDHFKRVNDCYGHPVGDEVLARVGGVLRQHTREQVDIAARYGGEEFVLLLPETDLYGAQHVAEKISARLRDQVFSAKGQTFTVTQSVGIAQVHQGDMNRALKVADDNLYAAKQAGRNRIVASVAHAEPLEQV